MNIILSIDRALSGKGRIQLFYLSGVILLVFLLLYIAGLLIFDLGDAKVDGYGFFKRLILVFIDPGSAWETLSGDEEVRQEPAWYFIITAILGVILFLGILISVISNILERRVERFRDGGISYPLKNHVVIIGFDEMVPMLVRQICRNKKYDNCFVLIQSSRPSIEVRNNIHAELDSKEEKRILFLNARRDSTEEIEKLYTYRAREVFIIGDRTLEDHDSMNIQCLSKIVKIHKRKKAQSAIPFKVMFENQSTFAAFQITDLAEEWRKYVEFCPINLYKEWADRLLVRNYVTVGEQKICYPRFDREMIDAGSKKHVHIVIVGMTRMGVALGEEAAHLLHFPNFLDLNDHMHKENRTVITFIDEQADTEMNFFMGRHPGYFDIASTTYIDWMEKNREEIIAPGRPERFEETHKDFLDVHFEFIKARIEDQKLRGRIAEWAESEDEILTIAVCTGDSAKAVAMGLYLPDIVYDKKIPVFVLQESSSALLDMLCSDKHKERQHKYSEVYPFGMLDNVYDLDDEKQEEAKVWNYIYDYYYANHILPSSLPDTETLNASWNNVIVSNQWSNLYLANSLPFKLHSVGYNGRKLELTQENIQLLARVEHNRWNMEKLLIGYRKPTIEEQKEIDSDENKKKEFKTVRFIHPDIRPYKQLSEQSKINDLNIVKCIPLVLK